jgi:hypothetical protein
MFLSPIVANAANYDEALNGDLSGNGLAPTVLALDSGSNLVQGLFGIFPVSDLDCLSVVVPGGYRLSTMMLSGLNPGGANSFLGLQIGSQLTMPPNSFDPSPLLGWNHIYTDQTGSDLLPALGITGRLGAGSYT